MTLTLEIIAWLVALTWLAKVIAAARGLPSVPNLLLAQYDQWPDGTPSITVIVPARNEAVDIAQTILSLLAQDYANLQIIAVNDRSTDKTGDLLSSLAQQHPDRLRVLHISELPTGWLGKTHAMALAARQATTDFLLFTDGDVLFRFDAIRRALANAVATHADHLVLVPTTTIKRWDEAAILGFFQLFSLWGARPWRISDPKATRDSLGIGAFNLIRREAYLHLGGFEALRMDVVEDLALGRRVKRFGLIQRVAFGRDLVSVHWASGAWGLVKVMTKNLFAAFRFNVGLALLACLWLLVFCVATAAGILWRPTRIPAVLALTAIVWGYRLIGRTSGLSVWNALAVPFSAVVLIFALLRSMLTTLRQGGVTWRGTFYPLTELRKNAGPLF
ncbi:MAG: glycosyltransferase family 2 protein [Acidobacteriota bacterium]|nr:glycosyltransferase family 2 protein [Acidobacteriota bacterium]